MCQDLVLYGWIVWPWAQLLTPRPWFSNEALVLFDLSGSHASKVALPQILLESRLWEGKENVGQVLAHPQVRANSSLGAMSSDNVETCCLLLHLAPYAWSWWMAKHHSWLFLDAQETLKRKKEWLFSEESIIEDPGGGREGRKVRTSHHLGLRIPIRRCGYQLGAVLPLGDVWKCMRALLLSPQLWLWD